MGVQVKAWKGAWWIFASQTAAVDRLDAATGRNPRAADRRSRLRVVHGG
jgi:hypothetical protein